MLIEIIWAHGTFINITPSQIRLCRDREQAFKLPVIHFEIRLGGKKSIK